MEDVKIGRHTQPIQSTVTASTTSKQLVPGSGARWQLVVCQPSSGVIWVVPGPLATAGQGYCLAAGDPPLKLGLVTDGQQVIEQWSVIADAGAPVIVVVEHRLLAGSDKTLGSD